MAEESKTAAAEYRTLDTPGGLAVRVSAGVRRDRILGVRSMIRRRASSRTWHSTA